MTREVRPLSARIHDWLRSRILNVTLAPGAPIVEAEIAARFEASRTPVREALLRLADEELVEVRPQRGTYVARLSLPRIESAMFIRQAIEIAVARRVVQRKDRAQVCTALASIVQRQGDALARNAVAAALDADTTFHRTFVDASGLPLVWEVVERARDLHHRIRAIAVPSLRSGEQALDDHRRIVAALRSGEAQRLERALARHLERNVELARAIAAAHPEYFVASVDVADAAW